MTTALATILAVVLAVLFAPLGAAKIAALPHIRRRADHAGFSVDAFRVIGCLEIAGALGLLIGIASWPIGATAGLGLTLLMIGALVSHLRVRDRVQQFAPAVVVGVLCVCYLVTLPGASR
ncbi:DoxX family protein [Nocardia aobensis]|uniref:DoxX family protein n=1 Tax=Nocardia aobensis TaxID=257277 RepID=UPI0002E4CA90|nr:DoxX family protein [Nocardia aobensis]